MVHGSDLMKVKIASATTRITMAKVKQLKDKALLISAENVSKQEFGTYFWGTA